MKNPNHLISIGSEATRRFCTTAVQDTKPKKLSSLFRSKRLYPLVITGGSVAEAANEYLREGKKVTKREVEQCVKQLRQYKRFQHALELLEWVENRGITLSYSDHAVRLDLLSNAKSVEAAEEYFNNLDEPAKNRQTYGALLNCYCKNKMTEKALAWFNKMDELNHVSSLAYNNLLTLYVRLGEPERVPRLVQEMKEKEIPLQMFTYNIWMNSYARLKDLDGVEKVIEEMHMKEGDKCDWTTYSNIAAIYVEAGLFQKAEIALKELEKKIKPCDDRTAYHFLISLYTRTSNSMEVHRVWNALKAAYPTTTNLSYLCMLQSLNNLDDFDGLKKCFEEWESGCMSSNYDMKLPNIVIGAYLRRDMFDEAKLLCEDSVKRGSGPSTRTHELFMDYFLRNRQSALAMKFMENAIKERFWKPDNERVCTFLKLFEEEKDVAGAEKFCEMLKKVNSLDSIAYRLLLSTYVAAGEKEPAMRQRLEDDKIEISSEIEELLERVCPL